MTQQMSVHDKIKVEEFLGRTPRGLEAIQVRNDKGEPSVIRVSSIVDEKPFPTLFWLVDPELNYWLDQLEASGLIRKIQSLVDQSADLQQRLCDDHLRYIELRKRYMSRDVAILLEEKGYIDSLIKRGIGGIADFSRIRCLHTYYAAHLVKNNTIGGILDAWQM